MLLSLCPNPCLDVYYYTNVLRSDDTNRVDNPFLSPGGKGVNAARVASRFCSNVFLALPLGGCIGRCVKKLLEKEGISLIVVETKGETRVNTILEQKAKGEHILVASRGTSLTKEEIAKLKYSICENCFPKVLILGGSVPPNLPSAYYADIVNSFIGKDTKVIVDADGELLKRAIEATPFAVKPNKHKLERFVGHSLLSLEDIILAAKEVAEYGVEVVIVSLGKYGAIALYEGEVFRIIPPKVEVKNTVGAGDSVVGGFACKLYADCDVIEALRFAIACGTATVMEKGTKLCKVETVKELVQRVKIFKL